MVMNFFSHIQNCFPSIKMPKIEKIILGTFSNFFSKIVEIFFENRRNAKYFQFSNGEIWEHFQNIFRKLLKYFFRKSAKRGRKTPIFELLYLFPLHPDTKSSILATTSARFLTLILSHSNLKKNYH